MATQTAEQQTVKVKRPPGYYSTASKAGRSDRKYRAVRYLTPAQLGRITGMGQAKASRLCKLGQIPTVPGTSRPYLIPRRYLEELEQMGPQTAIKAAFSNSVKDKQKTFFQ